MSGFTWPCSFSFWLIISSCFFSSHGFAQNGASYQGGRCERHHCSIPCGSDGAYPCTQAALFWEASQSLAQPAPAQGCQEGPLLDREMGKEEICNGQLAFQEINDSIGGNQDLARQIL